MKTRRPAPSSSSPAALAAAPEAARPARAPGLGARGDFLGAPIQRKDGLPDGLRGSLEALSGLSLDHVKVRYNSRAPDEVGAHAFTKGHEIHLARGQEQHLAHEAWHVVQQARRRVRPTGQVAGQALNDDHRLEREADLMGARAERMASSPSAPADPVSAPTPAPVPSQNAIQRDEWATDKLRAEAQAVATTFKTPGYTMHHKVAKSKLKDLAKAVAGKTSAKAIAFKAKVAEVTHHSLTKKGQDAQGGVLGDQLANMPMNIELGPLDDFREDKPGTNFDPNTVTVPANQDQTGAMEDATAPPLVAPQGGAQAAVPVAPRPLRRRMSMRSFHLKKIDDIINAGVPITDDHLQEMTDALEAAHRVHVDTHNALGKLTAPDESQWAERGQLTRKDGSKVSSYLRRGSAFTGGPGATGFLKEQAKEEQRAALARDRIRAEAEAAAASKRLGNIQKLNDRFRRSNMSQEDFETLAAKHGVKPSEYDGIFKNLSKYRGGVKRDRKLKAEDVIAHITKQFPLAEEVVMKQYASAPAAPSLNPAAVPQRTPHPATSGGARPAFLPPGGGVIQRVNGGKSIDDIDKDVRNVQRLSSAQIARRMRHLRNHRDSMNSANPQTVRIERMMHVLSRQQLSRRINRPNMITRVLGETQLRPTRTGVNSVRTRPLSLQRHLGPRLNTHGGGTTRMSRFYMFMRKYGGAGFQGFHAERGNRNHHIHTILNNIGNARTTTSRTRGPKLSMVAVDRRQLGGSLLDTNDAPTRQQFLGVPTLSRFHGMYDRHASEGVVANDGPVSTTAVKALRAFRPRRATDPTITRRIRISKKKTVPEIITRGETDDMVEELLDLGSAEPEPTFQPGYGSHYRKPDDDNTGGGGGIMT